MDIPDQTDVLGKRELINTHVDDQTSSLSIKEECFDSSVEVPVEFDTDKKFVEEKFQNVTKEHLESSVETDISEKDNIDKKNSKNTPLKVDSDEISELQQTSLIAVHNDDFHSLPPNQLNTIISTSKTEYIGQTHSGSKLVEKQKHVKKPFECTICKKSFGTKQNLSRHTLNHSGVKPYQCKVCKKWFTQKSNLKIHTLTRHGKNKSFQCAICNKSFFTKQSVKYHIISLHGGQKLFQCSLCEKTFVQKSCLTKHALTHSGEKSHKCSVCGNHFSQKVHLTRHMALTHSGKTIHECDLCKMSFSSKHNVRNHIALAHSDDKRHHCSICNMSFASERVFKCHKIAHSNKK